MAKKLRLVRESKLHRLLPGVKKSGRLGASGVAVVGQSTCLVIFDNLHAVAEIHLFLEPHAANRMISVVGLGPGFKDIAVDFDGDRTYLLVEAVLEADGKYRGFVVECDNDLAFLRCVRLSTVFKSAKWGFEGLVHLRRRGREYLWALCRGNRGKAAKKGGGRIQAFERGQDGNWAWSHEVSLPGSADFDDYAALDLHGNRLAVMSQNSARLWVGRIDAKGRGVVEKSGTVYRFPSERYGTVKGVAWLTDDLVVAVSGRRRKSQPKGFIDEDQSVHVFRIPSK